MVRLPGPTAARSACAWRSDHVLGMKYKLIPIRLALKPNLTITLHAASGFGG